MDSSTRGLIFATGEPAYAVDRDEAIGAWNGAAVSEFVYPRSQAVGRKCWELLKAQDALSRLIICLRRN